MLKAKIARDQVVERERLTGKHSLTSEFMDIENHPLKPFLPTGAKILILGSFPPQRKRWSMDFFYPNMQNDMWRIFGIIFFENKEYFITNEKYDADRIMDFCENKGIALYDSAISIRRLNNNASDNFLEVVDKVDLSALLINIPNCKTLAVTGQKALDIVSELIKIEKTEIGNFTEFQYIGRKMRLYRLPSSSRAYPKPLAQKAEIYKRVFDEIL